MDNYLIKKDIDENVVQLQKTRDVMVYVLTADKWAKVLFTEELLSVSTKTKELIGDEVLLAIEKCNNYNGKDYDGCPCLKDCCDNPDVFTPEHECRKPNFCTECDTRKCNNCGEICH